MSPLVVLLAVAGAALLLWPKPQDKPRDPNPFRAAAAAAQPSYQASLSALAAVRLRLLRTENLTDQTRAAIDTLTLALVSGSDKE